MFWSGAHFGQEVLVILIKGIAVISALQSVIIKLVHCLGGNGMHHRSTALFGSISYLSVVNIGRCDVNRGRGQGVEVEARTKQSPHGCIADDGSVRVKTECRPGS